VVIHSDTLEHIKNPIHGLQECRRVLKPNGGLCFTVPIIVGRLSRNRDGLTPSFHGNLDPMPEDFVVHTEFGADAWTYILEAGFTEVSIHSIEYPAAIAFVAKNISN
jgi:SAM-dependent methyltransferase